MASGTINLSKSATSGGYIEAKIVWSAKADVNANASKNVTASIYVRKDHTDMLLTIPTSGTWSYSITIDGYTVTGSVSKEVLLDWVLVGSSVVGSIDHSGDGTRSLVISGSVTAPTSTSFSGHVSKGSGTAVFDTIPRASTITSASNLTLGNNCSITWTPASSAFRYKLKFSLGNWSHTTGVIHPNKTSAYTYSGYAIPIDVAYQITNSYTGTMTVVLYTYSDSAASTQIGSSDTESFTVTVPSSAKPTVTMALTPVHSLPSTFDGIYVQGHSKVRVNLSAETQYNATIRYYDFTVLGKTYGEDENYTSGYLTEPETVDVTGHAVDSRSYGGYVGRSITVIPYSNPKIQGVSAKRCKKDGTLSEDGTYLKITAKRDYFPVVSGGVQKNFCEIRYRHKAEGDAYFSDWETILAAEDVTSDEVVTSALLEGKLLATTTYLVEVQAVDDIGVPALSTIIVPTEKVYWHRDGANNALGLGKYAEEADTLDSAWDIKTSKNIEAVGDAIIGGTVNAAAVVTEGNTVVGGTMSAADIGRIGYYRNLDFNTLTKQTGYYVDSSAPAGIGCSNYPVNVTGMIEVIAYGGSFAYQTYRTYDGSIYTRSYYTGVGWSVWKQVKFV